METTNLSTDLLRRLALMQHLGEDYFIVNGIAYEGTRDDSFAEYEAYKETSEDLDETFSFEDWLQMEDNWDAPSIVEELDIDDCYNVDYYVLTDYEADEKWEEKFG